MKSIGKLLELVFFFGSGALCSLFIIYFFYGPKSPKTVFIQPSTELPNSAESTKKIKKTSTTSNPQLDYQLGQDSVKRIQRTISEKGGYTNVSICNAFDTPETVTVRHCIKNENAKNGSDDSPVNAKTGKSIIFPKPSLGTAYLSRYSDLTKQIETSKINIKRVFQCNAYFDVVPSIKGEYIPADLIYSGQSGGLISKNGKPIGTLSTRSLSPNQSDEQLQGSWAGTFVFSDCKKF